MKTVETVIFDLGAVLIDWNPRHLYRKVFTDTERMEWFLKDICSPDWNEEQDAGRTFEEATHLLIRQHPDLQNEILAYWHRWEEMLGDAIHGTVDILKEFKHSRKFRIYALTNWSAETFPIALRRFEFLHWFDGIVMSGKEKTRKPFPEFYQILFNRYHIDPAKAIFIDDNLRNIHAAEALGLPGIHFHSPEQLRTVLTEQGLLIR